MSRSADSTAATASPSDAPDARLKEIVAAGNWRRWFTASEAGFWVTVAVARSGFGVPEAEAMLILLRRSGPYLTAGFTSSATRYWCDGVKIVEIRRWRKAL